MIITSIYNQTIEMNDVTSSVIKAVGYDYTHRDLYIQFNSGRQYVYNDFSLRLFNEFRHFPSTGAFYNQRIKGQFRCSALPFNALPLFKVSSKLSQIADSLNDEIENIDVQIADLEAKLDALAVDREALVNVQGILSRVR